MAQHQIINASLEFLIKFFFLPQFSKTGSTNTYLIKYEPATKILMFRKNPKYAIGRETLIFRRLEKNW